LGGGAFGGPPIKWDIALNLGDYAGFWDAPDDEQKSAEDSRFA